MCIKTREREKRDNCSSETMAEGGEQVVTPWEAHAAAGQAVIDYDKLISKTTNNFINLLSILATDVFSCRKIRQPTH